MNTLFSQISTSCSSILLKSARSLVGTTYNSLHGFDNLSWKSRIIYPVATVSYLGYVHCYSTTTTTTTTTKKGLTRKRKARAEPVMGKGKEKDAYFVVRKGDVVGVYKSLSECQAQVGSSICDPPVSVYKGYSLPKDAEEYMAARGLQNALYTLKASELKDDLFGALVPCPFQEPGSSKSEASNLEFPQKRPHDALGAGSVGLDGLSSGPVDPYIKHQKLEDMSSDSRTCLLEFDGASKGNPGPAGAGAVLRTFSGNVICSVRQGLGIATNNVAEYRAIILGLQKALEMGYTSIQAKGDSKLVCMQIQGLWKVKNQNMSDLYTEATKLKNKFSSFQISHVLRELNAEADKQANLAVCLPDGQVQENLG